MAAAGAGTQTAAAAADAEDEVRTAAAGGAAAFGQSSTECSVPQPGHFSTARFLLPVANFRQ